MKLHIFRRCEPSRHSRESGNPNATTLRWRAKRTWIPDICCSKATANSGMTGLFILLFSLMTIPMSSYAIDVPISLFPLGNYSQNIDNWLKPSDPDYDTRLVSKAYQQERLAEYYQHFFSTDDNASSPWSQAFIEETLNHTPSLFDLEKKVIDKFNNQTQIESRHIGYGENFRPYSQKWINTIKKNMDLTQLVSLKYNTNNRAITITNSHARILPSNEPNFYKFTLPGEGYPFDNLQMSALWAGTPVYILAQSKDKAWYLVITPSFIDWVKAEGIARVDNQFIKKWQTAAKKQLAAITKPKTSIIDNKGLFRFTGYIGSVFPVKTENKNSLTLLVPIATEKRFAKITYATVSHDNATIMPLAATPHNFAKLIKASIGRPYGWGGMYFYNDCSQEIKSLFTPFGIWLPRYSSSQVTAGKMIDKSDKSLEERLQYLTKHGRKLMTIVYIGGHVFLYLGNDKKGAPLSYQNLWGLTPENRQRRAVIGQAVLLPILPQYPEDATLQSLAGKTYFQVSYLDEPADFYLNSPLKITLSLS